MLLLQFRNKTKPSENASKLKWKFQSVTTSMIAIIVILIILLNNSTLPGYFANCSCLWGTY